MAKNTSFKDTSLEDIKKLLVEKREELRVLRFEATGGRIKDSSAVAKVRKDIARLLTEETAKRTAAQA